ncbi:hypothetical protein F5Y19DRAFT_460003 [Xylariaceae sp. FL1651]|nr:hypothetical protein F5Y19DRAFT_460003 [Xylariaceae sp. FL1651]
MSICLFFTARLKGVHAFAGGNHQDLERPAPFRVCLSSKIRPLLDSRLGYTAAVSQLICRIPRGICGLWKSSGYRYEHIRE